MKRVYFHDAAYEEMIESARRYEGEQSDLGRRFLDAVETAVSHIQRFPRSCPKVEEGVRRAAVKNFPYGVVYRCRNQRIEIVAIMHLHREPGYWKGRL